MNDKNMSYREAVRLARGKLERLRDVPDQAEIMAAYALHDYVNGKGENIDTLVELSKTQGLSWDAAKLVAMEFISKGHSLPESLRDWTVAVLAGDVKKPKTPKRFSRGWPGDLIQRDIQIHAVVVELLQEGMPHPMANETSGHHSACHAVADALNELKMGNGKYDTVRKIYQKREDELKQGRNLISPVGIMSQVIKPVR